MSGPILNRLEATARRIRMQMASKQFRGHGKAVDVRMNSNIPEIEAAMPWIAESQRKAVMRPAVYAAAIVVRNECKRKLAEAGPHGPNEGEIGHSLTTGTRYHQSKAVKARREGWDIESMTKAIRIKRWQKGTVVGAITGPGGKVSSESTGEIGAFSHILEYGGVIQLWGKEQFYELKPRPFLEPSAASTLTQQRQALVTRFREKWNEF